VYERRVLVIEDEALLRDLLAQTLSSHGFAVSTAANALEARAVFDEVDLDAIVVDINLGGGVDGFDVAEAMVRESPEIGVLFLTNLPDPRFSGHESGSLLRKAAYLRKSQLVGSNELIDALEAVLSGHVSAGHRHDMDPNRPLAKLSRMQLGVLKLVAMGKSNQQIALERERSLGAVESMLSRIFAILGIESTSEGNARVEAARLYMAAAGIPVSSEL
jgi:DNA-binding NarL/FixJ family response regulator